MLFVDLSKVGILGSDECVFGSLLRGSSDLRFFKFLEIGPSGTHEETETLEKDATLLGMVSNADALGIPTCSVGLKCITLEKKA